MFIADKEKHRGSRVTGWGRITVTLKTLHRQENKVQTLRPRGGRGRSHSPSPASPAGTPLSSSHAIGSGFNGTPKIHVCLEPHNATFVRKSVFPDVIKEVKFIFKGTPSPLTDVLRRGEDTQTCEEEAHVTTEAERGVRRRQA